MFEIEAILVRDPIDGFPRDKRLTKEKFEFKETSDSVWVTNKSNKVINEIPKANILSLRKVKVKETERRKVKSEQTDTAPSGIGKKGRTKEKRS